MEDKEVKIEIPFGANDSELCECEYTIPEGCKAEIKDGKVIIMKAECYDEKIEKHKEQKPIEWSEEDNEHIKSIISTIECCKAQFSKSPAVLEAYNSDLNWINSLIERVRPQKQWKPSEELIMYLCEAIDVVEKAEKFSIVSALKELLEKLKAL